MIAPKVRVIAGVEVSVATEPDTPFAVTTDTDVTVPLPLLLNVVQSVDERHPDTEPEAVAQVKTEALEPITEIG